MTTAIRQSIDARAIVDGLRADDLREQIDRLAAEQKALAVLYRAARAREQAQQRSSRASRNGGAQA